MERSDTIDAAVGLTHDPLSDLNHAAMARSHTIANAMHAAGHASAHQIHAAGAGPHAGVKRGETFAGIHHGPGHPPRRDESRMSLSDVQNGSKVSSGCVCPCVLQPVVSLHRSIHPCALQATIARHHTVRARSAHGSRPALARIPSQGAVDFDEDGRPVAIPEADADTADDAVARKSAPATPSTRGPKAKLRRQPSASRLPAAFSTGFGKQGLATPVRKSSARRKRPTPMSTHNVSAMGSFGNVTAGDSAGAGAVPGGGGEAAASAASAASTRRASKANVPPLSLKSGGGSHHSAVDEAAQLTSGAGSGGGGGGHAAGDSRRSLVVGDVAFDINAVGGRGSHSSMQGSALDRAIGAQMGDDDLSTVGGPTPGNSHLHLKPPRQPSLGDARRALRAVQQGQDGDSDGSDPVPDVVDDPVVPSKVARTRLTAALTTKRRALNLCDLSLRAVPSFHLPWLQEVSLGGNKLSSFPRALAKVRYCRALLRVSVHPSAHAHVVTRYGPTSPPRSAPSFDVWTCRATCLQWRPSLRNYVWGVLLASCSRWTCRATS